MKRALSTITLLLAILMLALTGCNTDESDISKIITLVVAHGDGSEKAFTIESNEDNLGAALLEEGLVSGSESSMGLFVTEVDGETADDARQEWWRLTKGGEMWNYGVSDTPIEDGDQFEFTLTTGY